MRTIKLVLVILFSIAIASCGGGGGGTTPTTTTTTISGKVTLSGTVAQGAAIGSATVTIKDKNGSTITGTTGTDGKYSIDVTGKTAPFLMKVPAGTGYLYSVATATATGTANIHPFTDLIIRNWYKVQGSDVETDFSGTSALAKVPTAAEINTIEAVIRSILSTNLTSVGVTASNFNLLTSSFVADHTGFDKVLDNTKVAVSTTGAVTVTATDPATGISGTMVSTNLTNLAVADTTKPTDPSGLSAIPSSTTSMVLVWNASTDNVGVAGYNIYRAGTKVGTSPYPVYSDTGLTSSTNYCYQVEAFDGAGNVSAKSPATAVCATTLAAADTTAPSAPTVLTATVASASQINLSWTASTSTDVAGYAIYRDTIKVAAVNGTSYSDKGLSSGTLYSYTVKALDGALNLSVASNTASATTTTAGTGVSQFDGTYTGSATDPGGTPSTATLTLTVANGVITGSFTTGSVQAVSGTVSATGSVTMTFVNTCGATVTFAGQTTVNSSGGVSMTGTASAPAAGTCAIVSATWTATKGLTIGTAFPIANTSLREMSASAAFDGTNFLVGIQGSTAPSTPNITSITAQFVSKTGALVGPSISTGGSGGAPEVAFDGTNYLLAWMGGGTYSTVIYGQLISTSGALVGSQFTIATGTDMERGFPGVIFDGTNYFVPWRNRSTAGNGDTADLFGQFLTPGGVTLGPVVSISTAAHGQREPSLAFDGTNILAVWADGRSQSACDSTTCYESDIYGQFITKSGASVAGALSGSNFLIDAGTLPRDSAAMGIGFDGTNYLVTFTEQVALPSISCGGRCKNEAYGILVTKTGAAIGSRFVIGNTTTSNKLFPQPAYLGTKYLVTWTDGFGTTSASLKGQYVTTSGAVSGAEFTLFSPAASGAVPWLGMVFTGGGVNLAVMDWGIPDATNPGNTEIYTSADVMGSIITIP